MKRACPKCGMMVEVINGRAACPGRLIKTRSGKLIEAHAGAILIYNKATDRLEDSFGRNNKTDVSPEDWRDYEDGIRTSWQD